MAGAAAAAGWRSTQVALFALGLMLAGVGGHPDTPWVVGALALAIAFAAATQDIAIDAYAVEVLRKTSRASPSGARTAFYRAAHVRRRRRRITLAGRCRGRAVNVAAGPALPPDAVRHAGGRPSRGPAPAPRDAARGGVAAVPRLPRRAPGARDPGFVVSTSSPTTSPQALIRPFLVDMGYSADDRGIALATIGLAALIAGTFLGGW